MVITLSSCFVVVTRQKGIRVCVVCQQQPEWYLHCKTNIDLFTFQHSDRPHSPKAASLSLILTREHLCAQCTFLPLSLASSQ